MISDQQQRRLAAAWERWDRSPSGAFVANLLEDECQAAARQLGMGATQLRIRIVQGRQRGLTAEEAVREACARAA